MFLKYRILLFISVLPIFLIGLYIYKKDREREPIKLLVKLFLSGIASCFLVLAISSILSFISPIFSSEVKDLNIIELFIHVFIGVALVEEISKWLMSYLISYNNQHFDTFYDAIIYCVFVALGFACLENMLYVFEGGVITGFSRALISVPGHACDGVLMGYYIGLAKYSELNNMKSLKRKYLLMSILVPTAAHGIYDFCLYSGSLLLILVFFAFIIYLDIYVINKIKKISSANVKLKYINNFCTACGRKVESNYCPNCGRRNY